MSKNAAQWSAPPKFPASHFVDSRIYTDEAIFAEEKEKLFKPAWVIACHESELPAPYDYRLSTHPAGVPLIIIRGDDNQVRAFYNICPHRGTRSSTTPRATRSA
jgi:methanesulfonate monooxygenase large subunit